MKISKKEVTAVKDLILNHIQSSEFREVLTYQYDTAHGIVLQITIDRKYKPEGPGSDRLEHTHYESPRLSAAAMQEILRMPI